MERPGRPQLTNVVVDSTTPVLVNNLDLRIERVGASNIYYPWVLNPDLTNKPEAVSYTHLTLPTIYSV